MHRLIVLSFVALFVALPLSAHCDWIGGPVVADARLALDKGDVTPILKWVTNADEPEIRDAFARTLVVRKAGPEAKELADRWLFETVVRIHRRAEGAPYEGLRGNDYTPDPSVVLAERALEKGSIEELEKTLSAEISAGLRQKFGEAVQAKEHAGHNVDAARHWTHAYAEFLHYALRVHLSATAAPGEKHAD